MPGLRGLLMQLQLPLQQRRLQLLLLLAHGCRSISKQGDLNIDLKKMYSVAKNTPPPICSCVLGGLTAP